MARMAWWMRPGPGLGDHEPVALAGEPVGGRDAHVVEDDLGVTVLVLVAEDRQVPGDGQTGGAAGDQDHRLLTVRGSGRIGLAHHDEDPAALVGRAGDPPFAAVDDVVVAVPLDAGGDIGRVRAGHVGLRHGKG
jgi:hypothetical protein